MEVMKENTMQHTCFSGLFLVIDKNDFEMTEKTSHESIS